MPKRKKTDLHHPQKNAKLGLNHERTDEVDEKTKQSETGKGETSDNVEGTHVLTKRLTESLEDLLNRRGPNSSF